MKRLFIRFLYLNILVIASFVINNLVSKRIINDKVVFSLKEDINRAIIGHSHSETAFNDSLINNFKNLSRSGESYYYSYHRLKKILEDNSSIDTLFVEFTNNQIVSSRDSWIWGDKYLETRYPYLEPFINLKDQWLLLNENPIVFSKEFINAQKNSYNRIIKGNYSYSPKMTIGAYNSIKFTKADSLSKNLSPVVDFGLTDDIQLSELNLQYLDKIIQYCNSNDVVVILLRSPLHYSYQGLKNENVFQKIRLERFPNVDFLDFRKFPVNNKGFGDLEHLNFEGANSFSLFFNELLMTDKLFSKNEKQGYIDEKIARYNKSIIVADNKKNQNEGNLTTNFKFDYKYKVDVELINGINVDSVTFTEDNDFWKILMHVNRAFSTKILNDKSIGTHLKILKKDLDKRPNWMKIKDSDIISFKTDPKIIQLNNRTFIEIKLKKSSQIVNFQFIKIFLQNKDEYTGIIGNSIRLENIKFKRDVR